jgi:mono/diheme cytochrome c family protein
MQYRPHSALRSGAPRLRRAISCPAAALLLAGTCWNAASAQDNSHPSGEQIFKQSNCAICHGEYGSGGAGPALRGDIMLRMTDYVLAQIMIGRGIMPSFAANLSDQEIAAVATYIRSNWGNNFGKVSAEDAANVRKVLRQQNSLPSHSASSGQKQQP